MVKRKNRYGGLYCEVIGMQSSSSLLTGSILEEPLKTNSVTVEPFEEVTFEDDPLLDVDFE